MTADVLDSSKLNCFLVQVETFLSAGDFHAALTEIFDAEIDFIKFGGFDLLILCNRFFGQLATFEKRDCLSEDILNEIVLFVSKNAGPKEALLGLLDLIAICPSSAAFFSYIKSLKVVFLKLPLKRGDPWQSALIYFYKCVRARPGFDYDTEALEDRELIALTANSVMCSLAAEMYEACVEFCEPFTAEALSCEKFKQSTSVVQRRSQSEAVQSFFLLLLDNAVQFGLRAASLTDDGPVLDTDIMAICEKITGILHRLPGSDLVSFESLIDNTEPSFTKLCLKSSLIESDEIDSGSGPTYSSIRVPSRSVGVLIYLIVTSDASQTLIKVHSAKFCVECLAPFINALLNPESLAGGSHYAITALLSSGQARFSSIGIDLCKFVLDRWPVDLKLNEGYLNVAKFFDLFSNLLRCMAWHPNAKDRRLALKCFQLLMLRLKPAGQLRLITMIFENSKSPESAAPSGTAELDDCHLQQNIIDNGIQGYLIDFYRSHLFAELQSSTASGRYDPTAMPFTENLPLLMLNQFAVLPNAEKSDLVDRAEQCNAALNLVRFLLLHVLSLEKSTNGSNGLANSKQRLCALLDTVRENFVEPLRRGLELSKAHYELELRQARSDNLSIKLKKKNKNKFGNILMHDRCEVIEKAVAKLDMMQSVLFRCFELYDSVKI